MTVGDLSARKLKAFDYGADVTKQLITLSTGIIGLVITFSKDILLPDAKTSVTSGGTTLTTNTLAVPFGTKLWLIFALVAFIISILFGLSSYAFIVRELHDEAKTPNIGRGEIFYSHAAQWTAFIVALILLAIYGLDLSRLVA